MPLFGKSQTELDQERQELLDELAEIRADLKTLRRERKAEDELVCSREKATRLEREITQLQITKDKLEEDNARKLREVTHQIGLEKKRQEFEIDSAKRATALEVREENLAHDKNAFEKEVAFRTERFEKEVGYLKGLMEKILARTPEITFEGTLVGAPNGSGRTKD